MLSLEKQYEFLFNGEPVARLTGNEFEKQEGKTLKEQVAEFFNSINNKSDSVFGEVVLDKRAFKDDVAHGFGREKIISFMAVPYILKKGIEILEREEHRYGIISGMVSAPITIRDKDYIGVVVVRKYKDSNRLYVHEVTLKEKLLVNASVPSEKDVQQGEILTVLQNIVSVKLC